MEFFEAQGWLISQVLFLDDHLSEIDATVNLPRYDRGARVFSAIINKSSRNSAIAAPRIARFTSDPNHRESELRLCCSRTPSIRNPFLDRSRFDQSKTLALPPILSGFELDLTIHRVLIRCLDFPPRSNRGNRLTTFERDVL